MARKKKSRFVRILVVLAVVAVAVALWVGLRVAPEAAITLRSEHDRLVADEQGAAAAAEHGILGPHSTVTVTLAEPVRGLGGVRVEFLQEGQSRLLDESRSVFRSAWKPWAALPRPDATIALTLDRETVPTLREGPATLRVTADRASGFLRSPDPVVLERGFTVRLVPPGLSIASTTHYVAQGGSEVVVYAVGENAARSGVAVGDWFFPGFPLPGGGERDRFALFAVPYDQDEPGDLRLIVEDEVGNRAEKRFVDRFFARPLGRDTIDLPDSFLEKVVPDILVRTPGLEAPRDDLLGGYLAINRDLRRTNRAELKELASRSRAEFLWRGAFLPLRNAKATAGFAERRTYRYQGRAVDTQDHLGFDLASVRRAAVEAANDGIVLRAGWFGIYGNAVVLDHGYGLLTLYGHLSSVAVGEGDAVTRGQELGRTGDSGLAGGDHLHFAVVLHGLPVNAREWWDAHWIGDRLRLKLGDALPE